LSGPDPRPERRRRQGLRGEGIAVGYLQERGWRILGRRIHVGRDELDLVAIDPGPPAAVVVVEVRSTSSGRFGSPEESVDRRKVARLYRASATLRLAGRLPDATPLPRLPWRVDLVAVDDAPAIGPSAGGPMVRHLRALEPG